MNDIEMQAVEAAKKANCMSNAKRVHGICFHNALHGLTCDSCGKVFKSKEDLIEIRTELIAEWC